MATEVAQASRWRAKRRRVFQSVFPTSSPSPPSQSHTTQIQTSNDHDHQPEKDLGSSSTYPSTAAISFLGTPHASQTLFGDRDPLSVANEQGQIARAWHIITSRLQFCVPFSSHDPAETLAPSPLFESQDEEVEFNAALQLVLHARQARPETAQTYDILSWYSQQVRWHLIQHVLPQLAVISRPNPLPKSDLSRNLAESSLYDRHLAVVQDSVQLLEALLGRYFSRLELILRAVEADKRLSGSHDTRDVVVVFLQDLHALISNSAGPITPSLSVVLESLVGQTLQMPKAGERHHMHGQPSLDHSGAELARTHLLDLATSLRAVGLAGESFQVLFAEIMDRKMTEYIHRSYAQVWKTSAKPRGDHGLDRDPARPIHSSQTSWCILSLCDWIENHFSRLALEVLNRVDKNRERPSLVSLADVQQWKEIGIGRIATLRISELFDIVLQWPASKGALDDLKASVTTPQRRWQLTNAFSTALQKRLLHPARSTLDILRVYISMIRTFHALDHSKVLLSRVVPSLQLYLVQREDAVRIVVTGLLANPEEIEQAQKAASPAGGTESEDRSGSPKLVELAVLLNDPDQQRRMDVDDEELDWDDMNWVPDPVDAGVNYKRPKSEDVIGTLISTLGAEDVFIKEFQSIIADNLLSTQIDFAQEQKVLDLLKKRFGESAIQNCEVMIKDIYDSRKVDTTIRRLELDQPPLPPRTFGTPSIPPNYMDIGKQLDVDEEKEGRVPHHARILSRLYWPNIVQETFKLPHTVAEQQKTYETGFEGLKSARKLTWLHQLGQATVELELEDRTVNIQCKTFEAAVIYAFHEDGHAERSESSPTRRSVQELQDELQMDEELVLQAVDFWESREVLARYSTNPNTYAVLERKDAPPTRPELHPSASAPAALEGEHQLPGMPPKPAGVKRAGTTSAMDAKENERRSVYWQFIVGMLTNTGPSMPLGQMAMMMRMLIVDGFPWSDQELQEFLTEKAELGELEIVGGKYKLAKK